MTKELEKTVSIARSGVQQYLRSEIPGLRVGPIPPQHADKKIFNVYRPAHVLAASKDLFAKRPFIYTHKGEVTEKNFSEWAEGWTGDSVEVDLNSDQTEAIIKSTLSIWGAEAKEAYGDGEREVSPWYYGQFSWADGVAPDGQEYQIIMDRIDEVNHVALVPEGRGGPDAAILDHKPTEGGYMTGIWRWIKKMVSGVKDEDMGRFRNRLTEIARARTTLNADQIREQVQSLRECIADLPDSKELELLCRYLDDAPVLATKEDEKEALAYVDIVASLYEKLDEQSIKEITQGVEEMSTKDGKAKDEDEEDKKKVADAEEKEEKKEDKEEDKKEEGKAKDDDQASEKKEDEKVKEMATDLSKEWESFHKHLQEGRMADGGFESLSAHMKGGGKISDWEPEAMKDKGKSKDAEKESADESDKEKKKVDTEKEEREVKDSSPFTMTFGRTAQRGEDPGRALLNKLTKKENK